LKAAPDAYGFSAWGTVHDSVFDSQDVVPMLLLRAQPSVVLALQLVGQLALLATAWKALPYLLRLLRPRTYHTGPPALATMPVRLP
jgi:hypothetical protein